MTTLADIAQQVRQAREAAGLSQTELARRAGVNRMTIGRIENLTKGDMSVAVVSRVLEALGYDLKIVKTGHTRTLEDILAEQRRGELP